MTNSSAAIHTTPQDIREFGDALIRTKDLDPVYCAIYDAKLPDEQLCRLLLVYWMFYHLGFSAYASERSGEAFWECLFEAGNNETLSPLGGRWPRGTERRHFRGDACMKAIDDMKVRFGHPEDAVKYLTRFDNEQALMDYVSKKWTMFGPWIAFKIADMMERVYGHKMRFNPNIGLLYKEPAAGLDLLVSTPEFIVKDKSKENIYTGLLQYFSARKAPPGNDRYCGPQEVETVLCKWKSMRGGHYWVGKDLHEVRHGLGGWGATADRMLKVMP